MVPHADNVSITKAGNGKLLGLLAQSVYSNQQAPSKQGNADHSERHCFQKQGRWHLRKGRLQRENTCMHSYLHTHELTHTIKM